ncbi:uncharacterized protein LOC126905416 [Daktulosphaira vitifoliae]|uniref:uncharacterized protein LOC126905416 n=1 Tax=Daktulosphaira vitifoliae TaxID=58002 RepID=UPI0021A9ECF3|nr:uncharacterized protein LOC126905416 [Daktulosphaira vitifoliae]
MRLKGKFYKTVVRPAMMYGSECWEVDKKVEQRMIAAKMRILRWLSGMTRKDRIRDEHIRGSKGVASIVDKMTENRLRLFSHVMRREESEAVRTVIEMNFEGRRDRGRPKKIWRDAIECKLRTADVGDRVKWNFRIRVKCPLTSQHLAKRLKRF